MAEGTARPLWSHQRLEPRGSGQVDGLGAGKHRAENAAHGVAAQQGLTGLVDTKFAERFGGAALISVIGAAPAVAAESANNETTSIVLGDVGSDLQDAVGSVIADQVSIAPTIYVDQGASVTVLVDRDVVIY